MIDLNSENFKPKNWGILYYFEYDIDNILIAKKKIINNSETYSKKLRQEFLEKIKSDVELQTKATNYEEGSLKSQYYQHFYGDTENLINQILQNHRKSSLLSIFSILEGNLKLISKLIEDEFDFKIKIKHITGSDYIHKYWLFLTKVFELDSKPIEADYNLIRRYKKVRNKIAHENSEVNNKMLTFIRETKGLRIRKFGEDNIVEIINDEYINELMNKIESFFKELIKTVDKRYGELKNVG